MPDARVIGLSGAADLVGDRYSPAPLRKRLAPYSAADTRHAILQLATTSLALFTSAAALIYGVSHGMWFALLLAVPASLFLVRLFVIQHDCGHGSFFKSNRLNNSLGLALSVMTLIPYGSWRRDHAVHHATAGNLDRRGKGDVTTLTVREYLSRSYGRRLIYRLYRHPFVLFVIGPAYMLLVRYRIPTGGSLRNWQDWLSILGTDVAAALGATVMAVTIGPVTFLITWGTVVLLAISIGVWFFYVQHQFEDSYWEKGAEWDFHTAALEGSSFYDLPRVVHWLTGSIGFHHIHHLASKIPNYRLRACFDQNPELQSAKRLTLWGSIKAVRLTLWDEERRKLVSFRALGQQNRLSSTTAE
jgi:omega-6 fatty acid desaturase (delta-12 desaturase)